MYTYKFHPQCKRKEVPKTEKHDEGLRSQEKENM